MLAHICFVTHMQAMQYSSLFLVFLLMVNMLLYSDISYNKCFYSNILQLVRAFCATHSCAELERSLRRVNFEINISYMGHLVKIYNVYVVLIELYK